MEISARVVIQTQRGVYQFLRMSAIAARRKMSLN